MLVATTRNTKVKALRSCAPQQTLGIKGFSFLLLKINKTCKDARLQGYQAQKH